MALFLLAMEPALGESPLLNRIQGIFPQKDIQTAFENVQILYVAGFGNEVSGFLREPFAPHRKFITEQIGIQNHTVIEPQSLKSPTENKLYLLSEIYKALERNPHPILLVGHSKGSAEIANTLLQHPDLIKSGFVLGAIFINGALGGSPLANITTDALPSATQVFIEDTLLQSGAKTISDFTIQTFLGKSIHELRRDKSERRFESLAENLSQEDQTLLRDRFFFFRSYVSNEHELTLLGTMRETRPHDGVLLVEDQIINYNGQPFGVDLGTFVGRHSEILSREVINSDYLQSLIWYIYGATARHISHMNESNN